ncbi:uroporphyrinogen-III synthase [Pelagibacteraceae bacterium]|nr:uroporphyrinogen-III synthase [Pelagibacteraceae bacterium]
MHILFTRPEIDSVYSAKKLIQLGHQVSVFPILNIVKKKIIDIDFTNYNSVVFTSSNAVLCLDQNIQSNVRCFCVGEVTAVQAKQKGFNNIITAGGNYLQLKETILNIADKNDGKFLYIRGEDIAHNLEEDLKASGYRIDSVINYTTSLNPDFDQKTLKILKDQSIDLIFVYSNRSAAHLSQLIFNNGLESKCSSVQLRSLSENVFFPLKKIKWKNVKMFCPGNEQFSLD